MPPQQSHGLLDGLNQRFGFGAHVFSAFGMAWEKRRLRRTLAGT
jgi:hypothetical protein